MDDYTTQKIENNALAKTYGEIWRAEETIETHSDPETRRSLTTIAKLILDDYYKNDGGLEEIGRRSGEDQSLKQAFEMGAAILGRR